MSEVPSTLPESLVADLRKWESEGHLEDYERPFSPMELLIRICDLLSEQLTDLKAKRDWIRNLLIALTISGLLGVIARRFTDDHSSAFIFSHILLLPALALIVLSISTLVFFTILITPILATNTIIDLLRKRKILNKNEPFHIENHLNPTSFRLGFKTGNEFVNYENTTIKWDRFSFTSTMNEKHQTFHLFTETSMLSCDLSKLLFIETLRENVPKENQENWNRIAPKAFITFCHIHFLNADELLINSTDRVRNSRISLVDAIFWIYPIFVPVMFSIEHSLGINYTIHWITLLWLILWITVRQFFKPYLKHAPGTPEYNASWSFFYNLSLVYCFMGLFLTHTAMLILSVHPDSTFITESNSIRTAVSTCGVAACGLLLWRAIVFGRRKYKHDHEVMKNYRETREKQSMDLWERRYEVLSNHLAEVLPSFDLASLPQ